MSIEVIIILLVALLATGTLLAGRAGIRSIQQARKVVFYRTRRSYMLAGWQWLVLALVLLSSTVASVLFGESLSATRMVCVGMIAAGIVGLKVVD